MPIMPYMDLTIILLVNGSTVASMWSRMLVKPRDGWMLFLCVKIFIN
jgi:hypothetical protein